MRQLVFIEGLWGVGKSYFLREYEILLSNSTDTLLFRNLRDYGSVRHAAYVILPDVYKTQNLIFDRSPITLSVLASPDINLYSHPTIDVNYWSEFYLDWLNVLKNQEAQITFLYFKPFDIYGLMSESIVRRISAYPKSNLLVNMKKFKESSLLKMHELYIIEIERLSYLLYEKSKTVKVQLFPVEYQDAECATRILNFILHGETQCK